MLGIMAGMDQEAWFAVFDVVPRAVLLLVSLAPDARHHGRLGPQDSVEIKSRVGGHISRVVGHSFGVEGHSPRVGGHSSRVEGHSSRVGGHSCRVGGHSSRVAEHSPRVGGHSSGVSGHSYRVGEHSSRVGGHSSRFGGHISRVGGHSFLWAIQTFSCGGSFARAFRECDPNVSVRRIEASFRRRSISESTLVSLAVVLRTCACRHVYWRCGITPGLQVSWHVFVCLARSVLVSTVRKLGQKYVAAPLLKFSFSCRFFEFVLRLL